MFIRLGANRTKHRRLRLRYQPRSAAESLMQRARALQTEYGHYPLPALVGKRVTELYSKGADVLTDDFAPADLYRMTPIGVPKRQ